MTMYNLDFLKTEENYLILCTPEQAGALTGVFSWQTNGQKLPLIFGYVKNEWGDTKLDYYTLGDPNSQIHFVDSGRKLIDFTDICFSYENLMSLHYLRVHATVAEIASLFPPRYFGKEEMDDTYFWGYNPESGKLDGWLGLQENQYVIGTRQLYLPKVPYLQVDIIDGEINIQQLYIF